MTAQELADLLLEADDPSAGARTGVYIFGPNLPAMGYSALDLNQAWQDLEQTEVLPKGASQRGNLIDQMVNMGYTFFFKRAPNDIEVIGRLPARTTPEGEKRAAQFLGLDRFDQVAYKTTPRSPTRSMRVDQVLYGEKEREPENQAGQAGQAAPAANVPMTPVKTDRPPGEYFKGQQQAGYGVPQPPAQVANPAEGDFASIDAPITLGLTIDMDSKKGIVIREVHPNGPAAQSGIVAGDVITGTSVFHSRLNKQIGPFKVYKTKHLENILKLADPRFPIPLRIMRGGNQTYVPVMPVAREALEASSAKKPVQTNMARKMFAGQPKAPAQRTLKLTPNEPSPSRETGNPPANVSSLT